jgi:phospholipid/cholesterol/gamma-HCH transport system substrate-binding protein
VNDRGALFKLTAFVLVTSVGLGLIFVVFGQTRFRPERTFHAQFADVSGLTDGQLVRFAGVRVGQVQDISVGPNNVIDVAFTVQDDVPLMVGTRVLVRYENLVGDRYLQLATGPGPMQPLPSGAVIPVSQTAPALDLDALLGGFQPLFEGLDPPQINQLSSDLVAVLQGEAGTVDRVLAETASLTNTLADRDQVIGSLIGNLNQVLGTVDQRDAQLSGDLDQLQRLVSGLSEDRAAVGDALVHINSLAGSVGSLLTDARPPLRGTIEQLHRTAALLDDNSSTVESVVSQLPDAYARLGRLGAYGSFFNFYLCAAQVKVTGPDGKPMFSPEFNSNSSTTRCQAPS